MRRTGGRKREGGGTNLAKDIPAAVHGHRPQHQQADGHERGERLSYEGRAFEHRRFLDGLLGREAQHGGRAGEGSVPVGDGLRVRVLGGRDGRVVAQADQRHALVVVVLRAEGVRQDGDVDQRAEEGDDVAGEHAAWG